ncbi:MAG: HD domain-containing protein [Coriobacteriia bacterium]|nr:HD domain-containing protein [Coriobacteriia bacterium]
MSDPSSATKPGDPWKRVTLADISSDPHVIAYIEVADEYLGAIGYTEHGFRHANLVSHISGNILRRLGFDERTAELGEIAGFMHDLGNCISREFHGVSAALLAKGLLREHDMDPREIAHVMNALGNHEEEFGTPANPIGAATIIADKADVHHTRVRNPEPSAFDIHDRVNYAAKRSFLRVDGETRTMSLEIEIDTETSQVMEYFEIFLSRMQMCRSAARVLDASFELVINGTRLL